MQKDTAFVNHLVKKKEHERSMEYHLQNIKNAKPLTRLAEGVEVSINNKKKQYHNELRFTEIERENRILLQKISGIMNKTKKASHIVDRKNKSLNSTFRRRQVEDIEIENAKLLKRLQQKKPNINSQKLKKQWIKQKNVMKIMSNFPFMLSERPKHRRRNSGQVEKEQKKLHMNPIELVRMRVINGISFLVTIQLSSKMLKIVGDCKQRKQLKVIQISRQEGIEFIEQQCHSKLQQIFNHLRYDKEQGVLYLVGSDVEMGEVIEKEKNELIKKRNEQELNKKEEAQLKKGSDEQGKSSQIGKQNEKASQTINGNTKQEESLQIKQNPEKKRAENIKEQKQQKQQIKKQEETKIDP